MSRSSNRTRFVWSEAIDTGGGKEESDSSTNESDSLPDGYFDTILQYLCFKFFRSRKELKSDLEKEYKIIDADKTGILSSEKCLELYNKLYYANLRKRTLSYILFILMFFFACSLALSYGFCYVAIQKGKDTDVHSDTGNLVNFNSKQNIVLVC